MSDLHLWVSPQVFGIDIHPGEVWELSQFLNLLSGVLVDSGAKQIVLLFVAAKIGEGILLDHGTGVVIGETAVISNRVSILHVKHLFSNPFPSRSNLQDQIFSWIFISIGCDFRRNREGNRRPSSQNRRRCIAWSLCDCTWKHKHRCWGNGSCRFTCVKGRSAS